jgi:hypothetical protein
VETDVKSLVRNAGIGLAVFLWAVALSTVSALGWMRLVMAMD